MVPRKTNLSLVENPAFIGSIIDVLVGIINFSGGFYRGFDKINQNYPTGIKNNQIWERNSRNFDYPSSSNSQITYSTRNISKFRYIPSKVYIKASRYSNLGYHWHNFANIHQVYVFFKFI